MFFNDAPENIAKQSKAQLKEKFRRTGTTLQGKCYRLFEFVHQRRTISINIERVVLKMFLLVSTQSFYKIQKSIN